MDAPIPSGVRNSEYAHIGKSVVIKGELSGSEDLYLDGQVEGSIELRQNRLTLGPNARVRARVTARGVTVEGKLEGNINASERLELRQSAVVMGDVVTRRIVIEEGAYFKGSVDLQGDAAKPEPRPEPKVETRPQPAPAAASAVAAATAPAAPGSTASPSLAPAGPGPRVEPKKF
jgi:cytoskeletal protein CcmA (bactofilin family)